MSSEQPSPPWQTTIFALIAHPSEPKVLLHGSEAPALPQVELYTEDRWPSVATAVEPLQTLIGAPLFPLRRAGRVEAEAERRLTMVLELELLSLPVSQPGSTDNEWVDADTLRQITLAEPAHRALIERVLDERRTGVYPAKRVPWARPGWYAEAKAWIDRQVSIRLGTTVMQIEVVRTWSLSCVLRIGTESGQRLFFKAAADLPLFVNEAVFASGLAEIFPDCTPRPLAADSVRQWVLLADVGGVIEWKAPLERRLELMRFYAGVQVESMRNIDRLLSIGAVDRRLDWTVAQIGRVLSDIDDVGLTDEEVACLQKLIPALQARCRELEEYRIPPALLHGDLHCGNVSFRPEGITIFDWTDACISHPFFDMLDIYMEEDAAVKKTLRDVYLSGWTEFESPERLEALWTLAEPAFALHHTISYWTIARHVEASDLKSAVVRFARLLIQTMAAP
jgi:hypothetical protein